MTSVFVECKRTDKVDFVKPLRKYIMQEFGKDKVEQYEKAIENLTTFREDLRLNTERTEGARAKYIQYITLLQFTEKHFRIGEKAIRINFYWYDSVSKKRSSQCSLDFEMACSRFNIAAIESQIAFLQNRSSDEGIKQACKFFQLAAGSFASLAELTRTHSHLIATPDLDGDYLTLLSFFMLAQAQECFYEKAERANMKPSILCKLAAQVTDYYEKAAQPIDTPFLKPSINPYWPIFIQVRIAMFKALANYHRGAEVFAEDKYGEQVAWLSVANANLSDPALLKKLKAQPATLQQQYMTKYELISAAYKSAYNDNSKIYHELVPRELPTLEKKAMVNAVAFKAPALDPKEDPFRGLISRVAQEATGNYKTKVNQRVQGISATAEENDRLAKATLSSLNLPDALQALEKPQGIPEAIRTRIENFKKIGGAGRLKSSLSTSQNYAAEAGYLLEDCKKLLKDEEELDASMRSSYGNQWVLPASHLANASLQQEISKYESNLVHAKKSDSIVEGKFTKIFPTLQKLCGSESEVKSLLPAAEAPSPKTQEAVKKVKELLGQLDDLIAARETLLKETLSVAESDDIAVDVMAGGHDPSTVMEAGLEKYDEFDSEIQANVAEQQELFDKLFVANQEFLDSISGSGSSREGAVRGINEALDTCQELFKNLGEGTNFYQQFCGLLNTLKSKCDKYVADRKAAKLALETRLSQPQSYSQGVPSKYYQQPHQPQYPQPTESQNYPTSYNPSPSSSNYSPASYQNQTPQQQNTPQQYTYRQPAGAQPQQFIQVQGPDGKPQYIPASSLPYYNQSG